MKNNENSRIFQIFQICSTFGVFQGNLRQRRRLWAVQRRLGGVWGVLERLGGFLEVLEALEVSWRHLGASWGHLGRVLGKCEKGWGALTFWKGFWEPKWRQKSLKFASKMQLALLSVFNNFCDFSCFCKSAGEDMYHFFILILHRCFVDFLLISNPSKP